MKSDKIKFRKKAVITYTDANTLNDRIQLITTRSWLIALGFGIIFFVLIIWAFFGTINTRVYGQGILVPQNGQIISVVVPDLGGYVQALKVDVGQHVTTKTIIAEIVNPNLNSNIEANKAYLEKLKKQRAVLQQLADSAINTNLSMTQDKVDAIYKIIKNQDVKLSTINHLVQLKQKAFQKGLITEESLTESEVEYYTMTQEISEKLYEIVNLKQEIVDFRDKWLERLRAQDALIQEANFQLNKLLEDAQLLSHLQPPATGTVVAIYPSPGDFLNKGEAVLTIVKEQPDLEAWVYVPLEKGKYINPGMIAQVAPTVVKKEEFGSIVGQVNHTSLYPVSQESLNLVLKNNSLASKFLSQGPLIAVKVKLKNANTFSGYQWTSSKGPAQKITEGTLVNVSIIVKKQRPISLVIPFMKKLAE